MFQSKVNIANITEFELCSSGRFYYVDSTVCLIVQLSSLTVVKKSIKIFKICCCPHSVS